MKNEAAVALGKLSHSRQSKEQSAASRLNGSLGGRPRTKSLDDPARSITEVNRVVKYLGVKLVRTKSKHFRFDSIDQQHYLDFNGCYQTCVNENSLGEWLRTAMLLIKKSQ